MGGSEKKEVFERLVIPVLQRDSLIIYSVEAVEFAGAPAPE
jgi:hypothetical protein